jgi:hypothetical protein
LADRRALEKAGHLARGGFVVGKAEKRIVRTRWEHGLLLLDRSGSGKSQTTASRATSGGEARAYRSNLTRVLEQWTWRRYRALTDWQGDVDGRFSWDEIWERAEPQAVFLTGDVLQRVNIDAFVRVFFGQGVAPRVKRGCR